MHRLIERLAADQAEHHVVDGIASGAVVREIGDRQRAARTRDIDRGAPSALVARYGRDNLEQVFLDIARNRTNQAAAQ